MLSDDQKVASTFEGKTFPAKLKAGIEIERKRQKVTNKASKKFGQQKQGFEKPWTYFGPAKPSRNPATPNDQTTAPEAKAAEKAKAHSDALVDATGSGNMAILAQINFIREQLAAVNVALLKTAKPRGGNVPAIVDALKAISIEAKLLADYKAPGDHTEPTKEKVAAASITAAEQS
jgi:hypothetical protein